MHHLFACYFNVYLRVYVPKFSIILKTLESIPKFVDRNKIWEYYKYKELVVYENNYSRILSSVDAEMEESANYKSDFWGEEMWKINDV